MGHLNTYFCLLCRFIKPLSQSFCKTTKRSIYWAIQYFSFINHKTAHGLWGCKQLKLTDKGCLTSKVRTVRDLCLFAALCQDSKYAVLDEIHLLSHCPFSDNVISWLEHFETQLGEHWSHKVGICIGEQRHGGHKLSTVKTDDFL